jgi:hypothetical protein
MLSLLPRLRRLFRTPSRSSYTAVSRRPLVEQLEDRRLLSVQLSLLGGGPVSSYAGVGFRENPVANLSVSVDGQADPNRNDFQATINWGDGASSTGDLVYQYSSGGWSFYLVKGSHIYSRAGSAIPITVTISGPEGSSVSRQTWIADVSYMPSGIPGTQPPATATTSSPADVQLSLTGGGPVGSYAGVGFQENPVANLSVSVNGQADPYLSDFHVEINWGDSDSWTSGDLVYQYSSGGWSYYLIKGSHIYQQAASAVPIVVYVTGPDGTSVSRQTWIADVSYMPSGIPGTQPPAAATTSPPADVQLSLTGGGPVDSYAGVGFQEQPVANLSVSVNGRADPRASDFHVEINWGDSASWTPGDLVYGYSSGGWSFYTVQGSHVYAQPASDIPIVMYITGPDGTSASRQTWIADVAPNPNPPVALGPLSPTQWTVNQPGYSGTITVSGGTGAYGEPLVKGLPAGLSAALSGNILTLSGTPSQTGTFTLTVSVQDSNGDPGSGTYSLTINPPVSLGALSPTQWDLGQPGYDGTISVSGGTGGYSDLQVTGPLPAGLSASLLSGTVNGSGTPVQSGTIIISGTPTQSGTFTFDVTLRDGTGATDPTYTLTINPALSLGDLAPAQWTVNQPGYEAAIPVSGGTGSYGNLQTSELAKLGLSALMWDNTILIRGTPSQSGTFNIWVAVEDSNGNQISRTYSLTINPPVSLGALSPARWALNEPGYAGTIPINGGTAPYHLQLTGPLPSGVSPTLSGNTILLSGTPKQAGTFPFTVLLSDATGSQDKETYTLTVQPTSPRLTLSPAVLHTGTAGEKHDATITATGGSGNYTFTLASGHLPTGLQLLATGEVAGLPTSVGTFTFTVKAADTSIPGLTGSRTCTLTINPGALYQFAVSAPATAIAGTGFRVTITAQDSCGNTVTGYSGRVTLTSSDNQTLSPASASLSHGTGTAIVTLDRAGVVRLTAASGGMQGTSNFITVSAAAVASLTVSAPSTVTVGVGFPVTITAKDRYGNAWSGHVTLTAAAAERIPPLAVTLVNGTATPTITLQWMNYGTQLKAIAPPIWAFSGFIKVVPALQWPTYHADLSDSTLRQPTPQDIKDCGRTPNPTGVKPGNNLGVLWVVNGTDPTANDKGNMCYHFGLPNGILDIPTYYAWGLAQGTAQPQHVGDIGLIYGGGLLLHVFIVVGQDGQGNWLFAQPNGVSPVFITNSSFEMSMAGKASNIRFVPGPD